MPKYLSFFLLFTLPLVLNAHPGGHGHITKNDRVWHLTNGSIAAAGSFLMAKEGRIYIEQETGFTSFLLQELSIADQAFAQTKIDEIDEINAAPTQPTAIVNLGIETIEWLVYSVLSIGLLLALYLLIRVKNLKWAKYSYSLILALSLGFYVVSCNNDDDKNPDNDIVTDPINESDPVVMAASFEPYSDLVSTRFDDNYFYVESTGIPNHSMMVGITAWIAQVPIPYPFTGDDAWSIPLNPEYSSETVSIEDNLRRGAIGLAANGIPIFNPINASGLVSKDIGELDEFGGHSGRGDDYHYHTAPLHLESTSGSKPIAYALDGYPVYGSLEPDGTKMEDLDEFHGHEYNGSYHYHGTTSYPFMVAKMRGKVTLEGTAPETQIEPQPVARALRKDIHPINSDNLVITNMEEKPGGNGYVITYTINGVEGSVDYFWDENSLYTFIFNDVDGTTTTETYTR